MRRQTKPRRGAVAALTALGLVAIVGVAALVVDGGLLRDQRRRVQASADAAALAAAYDLFNDYSTLGGVDTNGTARASALATAAANGYTNDGKTSVVTVNIPPKAGPFAGQKGFAEVVVQYNQRRGLSAVFGKGDLPVRARAVARGIWKVVPEGILILDPTSAGSLKVDGNGASMRVTGAPVIVNSTNAAGVIVNNGFLSAPEFYLSGLPGYSVSGGKMTGTIYSNQDPTPDPLEYLPAPDPSSLTIQSSHHLNIAGKRTLYPGRYIGGISLTGNADVTMMPGIYYLDGGGFKASGSGDLIGNGVLLYNAPKTSSDVISIAGGSTVNLSPMTSGTYAGITLFQDRTSMNTVSVTGAGNMTVSGAFYAPKGTLAVNGGASSDVIGSQYISYRLYVTGNGSFDVDWNAGPASKQRLVGLVE